MPAVSVIVPTFNRPALLARALESIRAQTCQDFEIIVCNDGGLDVETVALSCGAAYIAHAANCGLPAARNTAMAFARGQFVAYLDDDDVWYPNHLEALLPWMGLAKLAYTDSHLWTDDRLKFPGMSVDYSRAALLQANITPVCCVMHHRSLFEQCGVFDVTLANHEDYDLWLRFSEVTRFIHVPEITCAVSVRADTMSSNRRAMITGFTYVNSRYKERVGIR